MGRRFVATVLSWLVLFATAANSQDLDPNHYYRLTTQWQGEGKSLGIVSDAENNKPLLMPSADSPAQMWKLAPLGNGFYRLTNQGQGDGKSLDIVSGNSPVLGPSSNASGQIWKLTPIGSGFYRLTNQAQGDGRSLDIVNDGQNNRPILAASGNYSGQMWKFTKLVPTTAAVVSSIEVVLSPTQELAVGQIQTTLAPLVIEPTVQSWPPLIGGLPKAGGSLVCSRAIGTACGTTKADWVGAYTLNLTCKSGFYDPIYGGTCWKCPDDTDQRGGWIRSATAVTGDDACWRMPKESVAHATKVKKTSWAWECPSGSFWDGYDWGGCWTCPADHPRRTAAAVWASNACASTLNETRPANFLAFNGCPKPDAATMGLKGKRLPGKPFLDIAGGWNQGVASGGCYACPVTDEEGNILITERNANPIYGENQGCDVLFKWKPNAFPEPGMAGLAGMKEFIVESKLFDSATLTEGLYDLAESRGLGRGTPAAKDWVVKQWQEIAATPYRNEQVRAVVFAKLLEAAALEPAKRTPAQTRLINAFQDYAKARRIYLAEMGLAMYDAWKAYDDKAKQSVKRSSLMVAFDYGTVPLDFHGTLSAVTTLGATGAGLAGTLAAAHQFAAQVQLVKNASGGWVAHRATSLFGLSGRGVLQPLNLLKGTAAANAALAGATAISVAFAVIQSVAIDQFIAIQTARPKLEAALSQAQQPVDLRQMAGQPNGSDLVLYYWAKAMEVGQQSEDPQMVAWAAASHRQAQSTNYQLASAQ